MVVQLAASQHCSNGITMCVQNQWAFLKVEILNSFKSSVSRRVNEPSFPTCIFIQSYTKAKPKNVLDNYFSIFFKSILHTLH